jgi:hypothetical protein
VRLADGIRKHGFRKWYERELLQSHAHLALTIVCSLGIFGGLESFGASRALNDHMADVATVLLCTAVGLWALRRYLFLLSHAEAVAHQADCPGCGTYARLQLVQPNAAHDSPVEVSCRSCGRQWSIEE